MPKKQLVAEALIDLHRRLSTLPARSHERRMIMQETANLYGVSEQTLYRALAQRARPRALRRSDRGTPRVLPQDKMEYYCELIAANQGYLQEKPARRDLEEFELGDFHWRVSVECQCQFERPRVSERVRAFVSLPISLVTSKSPSI